MKDEHAAKVPRFGGHLLNQPKKDTRPAKNINIQFSTANFYNSKRAGTVNDGVDYLNEDVQKRDNVDEPTDEEDENDLDGDLSDDRRVKLPLLVLIFLYLERFLEIMIVFFFTLLAITWGPLLKLVGRSFWFLLGIILLDIIALAVFYQVPWFKKAPGFIVFKLLFFLFLAPVFLLLAIHIPREFTFLSAYFALVALGSTAATYCFFALISLVHHHFCTVPARGCYLYLVVIAMPIFTLISNQPVYFSGGIWHFSGYWDFIANLAAGIVTYLPFSYEAFYIYQSFIDSNSLQEFGSKPGLLPGFATVYCINRNDESDISQSRAATVKAAGANKTA